MNALATLVIGNGVLFGQIKRIETHKRREPVVLSAGENGAIELEGIETNDLPMRVYGGQMIVDTEVLKGAVIRSRHASDTPPNSAA